MNIKTKNKFLIILSIFLVLASTIIPNYVKAVNIGDDIKFIGYGTVPLHLQGKSLNGGYYSTHLVGYYEDGVFYPAYCLNRERVRS